MVKIDDIWQRIQQEKNIREEQQRKIREESERKRIEFLIKERRLYEKSIVVSSAVAASAGGGGGGGTTTPTYASFRFDMLNDGDSIGWYNGDVFDITIDWGDGSTDIISSYNSGSHNYTNHGIYNVKLFNLNITSLYFSAIGQGEYSTMRKSEYENLTSLKIISFFDITSIEDNTLDNCPLENFYLKWCNLTNLKSGIFNGISTLKSFYLTESATITGFDNGVFSGLQDLSEIRFYNTPFSDVTLVDSFLINLNNIGLSNCVVEINSTDRTGTSDNAVSELTSRGCAINVTRLSNVLSATVNLPADLGHTGWFSGTLSYTSIKDSVTFDWGDSTSNEYNNESKKKGGWAYFPQHNYITLGAEYTLTAPIPTSDAIYFYIYCPELTSINFPFLTGLETLYLEGSSNLTTIDVSNLPSLKYLYVDSNGLESRPGGLPNTLEIVDLSYNNLGNSRLLFNDLTNLNYIDLTDNGITSLSNISLHNLPSLQTLYLGNNLITSLLDNDFSWLTNLESLYLNGNRITSIPSDIFSGLTNLVNLVLNDNQIGEIEVGAFNNLPSVAYIALNNNQLSGLTNGIFGGLNQLWYNLDLNTNYITSLPNGIFSDLSTLISLNLNQNILTELTPQMLSGLTSIQNISFNQNEITTIHPDTFIQFSNSLQSVDLNYNLITGITSGTFSNMNQLTYLYIQTNQISYIEPNSFSNSPNLSTIHLISNGLYATGLTEGSFSGITTYGVLSLEQNILTGIDPNVFNGLGVMSTISFYHCSLTSTDVDNLLIKFDNDSRYSCSFYFDGQSRTSASDTAIANLRSRNVYIQGV